MDLTTGLIGSSESFGFARCGAQVAELRRFGRPEVAWARPRRYGDMIRPGWGPRARVLDDGQVNSMCVIVRCPLGEVDRGLTYDKGFW